MPVVKIELSIGRDRPTLLKIRNSVMDSVVEALQIQADDRDVRLIEYQQELFLMKPPYEILIEISLFAGRTKETKRKLFQTIVDRLESNGLFEKKTVFIILNEQPLENWGIRGGIPSDEIDLGFNVKI